ncbi:EF-hand domain-containing protein [Xanthomonas campestris pv. raphani]|nr:EF-hand domain-containing protein [Xanthomonas campestris pv. campestris]
MARSRPPSALGLRAVPHQGDLMTTLRTVTCFLLLLASGTAWSQQAPTPASSMPLIDVPSAIRTQPLASGEVTHQAQLERPRGESSVIVRSIQPTSVVGSYRIDFQAMDTDGDGRISRAEAQANPALADEFDALDTRHSGALSREQLAGWLIQ